MSKQLKKLTKQFNSYVEFAAKEFGHGFTHYFCAHVKGTSTMEKFSELLEDAGYTYEKDEPIFYEGSFVFNVLVKFEF